MKKGLLIISTLFCISIAFSQTNATDASPIDCDGITHNLFQELDAGKVIVIGWTMPCATCASPLLAVHNAVLNYAISNPGVVEYWLADDFANTNCTVLEDWATSAGINNAIFFSSAELSMFDYGSAGMPKVVVLGCTDHKVYYNKNDTPSSQGATNAINTALSDIAVACQLGLNESDIKFGLNCFPNPAASELTISFENNSLSEFQIELFDLNGSLLKTIEVESSNELDNTVVLDISDLVNGFYLLKLSDAANSELIKVQVLR